MSSTNTPTAQAATIPEILPLNDLTLIGLFNGPDGPRALLRTKAGDIQQVGETPSEQGVRLVGVGTDWALIDDTKTYRRINLS